MNKYEARIYLAGDPDRLKDTIRQYSGGWSLVQDGNDCVAVKVFSDKNDRAEINALMVRTMGILKSQMVKVKSQELREIGNERRSTANAEGISPDGGIEPTEGEEAQPNEAEVSSKRTAVRKEGTKATLTPSGELVIKCEDAQVRNTLLKIAKVLMQELGD